MRRIQVLMSTYNGERYVEQQVTSILGQRGVDVTLTIRDDGSTDGTVELLHAMGLDAITGDNLRLPRAFFHVIEESGPDFDLWALADQDDVWLPHKLQQAAAALAGVSGPALYCARVLVTDERLRPLYPHAVPARGPSFANALVQNIATGCTIVFNAAARDLLRGRWPTNAVMHDAWLYAVLAGCGTVLYDPRLVVLYRQHDHNSVGVGAGPLGRTAGRVRRQLRPGGAGAHGRQNEDLMRTHGDLLQPAARAELAHFLHSRTSFGTRLRYSLTGAAHRQTRGSNIVLSALQVANRV